METSTPEPPYYAVIFTSQRVDDDDPAYARTAERMIELANKNRSEGDPVRIRMLSQAARELLLAQSSDWAFIMKTRTMVDYAVQRTKDHLLNFRDLWRMLEDGTRNDEYLTALESRHTIFPSIDFRVFAD
jgi:1,4-alpha-glucan branching enzyme